MTDRTDTPMRLLESGIGSGKHSCLRHLIEAFLRADRGGLVAVVKTEDGGDKSVLPVDEDKNIDNDR